MLNAKNYFLTGSLEEGFICYLNSNQPNPGLARYFENFKPCLSTMIANPGYLS